MTDRKYVVLNTSIQTGSNASQLLEDADGNVAAQIELRLPDNIFSPSEGGLKVDTVSMLTTKFRVSLSETPIASIPLDLDLSSETVKVSTCKLDVYPYVTTDTGTLEPYTRYGTLAKAFPFYKSHNIVFNFYTNTSTSTEKTLVYSVTGLANTHNYLFPKNSPFYPVLNSSGILNKVATHCLNLALSINHTSAKIENEKMLLNGIGAIEHLISDALANAMLYASTSSQTTVDIDLALYDGAASLDPSPISYDPIEFEGTKWVLWKYTTQTDILNFNNSHGIHPKVTINENSLTLSYDTAAFGSIIPVLWNTSFISNYDMPIQTTLDNFLSVLYQPPPKRIFKYGLSNNGDNGYHFTIPEDITAAVFNIIGNKIMKETFPFLPWIKLSLPPPPEITRLFDVKMQQRTVNAHNAIQKVTLNETADFIVRKYAGYTHNDTLPIANIELPDDGLDYYLYTFTIPLAANVLPENRTNQQMYWGPPEEPISTVTEQQDVIQQNQICSYENDLLPPDIQIISEETTITPAYPVGITEIDSQTTFHSPTETGTNTYTDNQLVFFYASQGQGQSLRRVGVAGTHTGTWDPSFTIQAFPYWDPTFVYEVPSGDPALTKYVYIWRASGILLGQPDVLDEIHYTVDDLSGQKITVTQEANVTDISTSPTEVDYIPNIYEGEDLFMLDCASVNVDIAAQEPIDDHIGFTITTNTTTEEHYTVRSDQIYSDYGTKLEATVDYYNHEMGIHSGVFTTDPLFYTPTGGTVTPGSSMMIHYTIKSYNISDPDEVTTECDYWAISQMDFKQVDGQVVSVRPYSFKTVPYSDVIISSTTTTLTPSSPVTTTIVTKSYDPSLTTGTTVTPQELVHTFTGAEEITSDPPQPYPEHFMLNKPVMLWNWDGSQMVPTSVTMVESEVYNPSMVELHPLDEFVHAGTPLYYQALPLRPDINLETFSLVKLYEHVDTTSAPGYRLVTLLDGYLLNNPAREPDDEFINFTTLDWQVVKIATAACLTTDVYQTVETIVAEDEIDETGNLRLSFTWLNLPTVVLSPIQSFVMLLSGMQVTQEIQPINIAQAAGSSLVSSVPIIENYYSLAQTLRDLHDELVVVKDSFNDAVTYKMKPTSGMERTLTFTVKYLTKDGRLHQLYIPKNGVFTLQLTFELSYYMV